MKKKNQPASLKIGKTARIFLDTFKYEVIRTKRKTLTLYVKQQRVIVRCPLAATNTEINEFIETNQDWILDRLKEDQIFQKETLKALVLVSYKLFVLRLVHDSLHLGLLQASQYQVQVP